MNTMTAPMLTTALVTLLGMLQLFYTGIVVAQMRGKHGIKAPAMTGHPEFECAYRVQMNTLEWTPLFLVTLWLAAIYFTGWLPPIVGAVWVIGRVVYMQGYMAAPEKRSTGFGIQALAVCALFLLALWGIVQGFLLA